MKAKPLTIHEHDFNTPMSFYEFQNDQSLIHNQDRFFCHTHNISSVHLFM